MDSTYHILSHKAKHSENSFFLSSSESILDSFVENQARPLKHHLIKTSLMAVHCASELYHSNSRTQTNTNTDSNPSGLLEVHIKERYILKFQSDEGVDVVLEDITSPEYVFVLSIPVHFPTPLARTVHIKDMVSRLNLGPDVCEFLRAEITEVVAETKVQEEFKKMLAVQVTKVELIGKEEIAGLLKKLLKHEG